VTLEIVTSWKTLFQLAHAEGRARIEYQKNPHEANAIILRDAIRACEDYRQMCIKADRMIDFPEL